MESPLQVAATSPQASVPARPPDTCLLVLFGATGDLAHRKIVPALFALHRNAELPSPFGVLATSTSVKDAQSYRAELRQSLERFEGHAPDAAAWERVRVRDRHRGGGLHQARGLPLAARGDRGRGGEARHREEPALLPGGSAGAVPADPQGPERGGAAAPAERRAVVARRDREAVRARPRLGPRAEPPGRRRARRAPDLPHRPLPGQGDGPEHPGVPLRQLDLRAALEPQVRRPRPDHDGRGHRRRAARQVLRRDRRRARRGAEPPAAGAGARARWSCRRPSARTTCATRS